MREPVTDIFTNRRGVIEDFQFCDETGVWQVLVRFENGSVDILPGGRLTYGHGVVDFEDDVAPVRPTDAFLDLLVRESQSLGFY
jgi:hypothetical protein